MYNVARLLFLLCCGFALYRSVRVALADAVDTRRAMRIEPNNELYLARNAVERNESGDPSDDVDSELRIAVKLNPADSAALRTLGMRSELAGDHQEAERYLLQATAVDHTFKPAWALANFYARAGDPVKFQRAAQLCLQIIEPRIPGSGVVSAESVFDLCWSQQLHVPVGDGLAVPYVEYLVRRVRTDEAVKASPAALRAAHSSQDYQTLMELCDFLVRANRSEPAVRVWNYLVDSGFIRSTRLAPRLQRLIADPDFGFPVFDQAFGWKLLHEQDTFVSSGSHFVSFEMTGNQPEHFELLAKVIPVDPDRHYRITWKADLSRTEVGGQKDPGLAFHLSAWDGAPIAVCPLRLATAECSFRTPRDAHQIRMTLQYDRPQGSTRIEGIVKLSGFMMEFQR
jgi:tetratricopeptide (TPR) repeat protein